MNAFNRYTNMIRGEAVDIVPRVPILMQFAAEYIGSNYGSFASDHHVLAKANEVCASDFCIDQLSTISDPYRETQGFGSTVEFPKDSCPSSTHPLAADNDILRLVTPDPQFSEHMRDRIDAINIYRSNGMADHSVLGWVEGPAAEASTLRDPGNFLMDLMIDESYACKLMDVCLANAIGFARAQLQAGADTIGIGDAIASQVSADIYERLILPREAKLVSSIKKMDAYVRLHICGDITHLLPGIAELDIDILDVDHMVNLTTVRKTVGPDITIAGNIDPVEGVLRSTPDAIRDAIRACYKQAGNPFMVNAGCEIPAGTPKENLLALCEPIAYKA